MARTKLEPEVVRERALEWYETSIKAEVEEGNEGKFLVINVVSGEYEMDADDLAASVRARKRFPDAPLFALRVGSPAAYHLGAAD
jgi:hypothetical protein